MYFLTFFFFFSRTVLQSVSLLPLCRVRVTGGDQKHKKAGSWECCGEVEGRYTSTYLGAGGKGWGMHVCVVPSTGESGESSECLRTPIQAGRPLEDNT
ncbi:hypothetical protein BX600DRAFT_194606 [Xylariales sp. PMI_506]|nr:hypothetical protein BX600DRAFT_194606 [Xylariales sp. PMI_506]